MRKTVALTSLLLLLSLMTPPSLRAQRGESRAGVRLVETGGFHGDEVSARTGETWLGLYVSGGRSALVPSVLTVEPADDVVVDEGPWQMTGKVVSVNRKSDPLFLISGAGALKPGPVVTSRARSLTLADTSDVRVTLAGARYRLKVSTRNRSGSPATFLDDARLVLSKGNVAQVIYDLRGEGDAGDGSGRRETVEWKLLWAGDLDGDRRLDLYVQVSWNYNVVQHKLFLSSRAGAGRLVREAAEFRVSGC
jgi:hypothetical protein